MRRRVWARTMRLVRVLRVRMVSAGGVGVVDGGAGVGLPVRGRASRRMQRASGNDADEFGIEAAAPREVAPREEVRRPTESRSDGERVAERGGRDRGGRDRGGRDRGGRDRGGRESGGRDSRLDSVRERFGPRGARPGSADDEVIDLSASAGSAVEPFSAG